MVAASRVATAHCTAASATAALPSVWVAALSPSAGDAKVCVARLAGAGGGGVCVSASRPTAGGGASERAISTCGRRGHGA